jgi:hypothetical protein
MPSITNFKSNLSSRYGGRYTVSRIIADMNDDLLSMEIPADFPLGFSNSNIEVHLYSLADNSLLFSFAVRNNKRNAIVVEKIKYSDGSVRNLLYINFAKMDAVLVEIPSGRFSATLNFFLDEIGSYDDKILKVSRISTSRTEVELALTNPNKQSQLEQFAIPRINLRYIQPVLLQIFNQSGSSDLNIPVSPAKIDSSSIYRNFTSGSGQQLVQYGFDIDNGNQIGINTIAQNVLDDAYPLALRAINTLIQESGSTSFTESELTEIVVNAIDEAYDFALKDEQQNPQNYRFDLI